MNMKWTSNQDSYNLNIANGLIRAIVQWDILYGKGYKAVVNSSEVGIYPYADEAKLEAEKYIKRGLRLALNEIGGILEI